MSTESLKVCRAKLGGAQKPDFVGFLWSKMVELKKPTVRKQLAIVH